MYDLLEMVILMVGVAQLAEHQVVALRVVGSSPITHPIKIKRPLQRTRCSGLFLTRMVMHVSCWIVMPDVVRHPVKKSAHLRAASR